LTLHPRFSWAVATVSTRIVNSVAPIRICDLGGWTDTWFAEHGNVLNISVYPYVQCQMVVRPAAGDFEAFGKAMRENTEF